MVSNRSRHCVWVASGESVGNLNLVTHQEGTAYVQYCLLRCFTKGQSYAPHLTHRGRCLVSVAAPVSEKGNEVRHPSTPQGYVPWVRLAREWLPMAIEGQFVERWKELEVATRLAFPKWDGREVEKFLKLMRVEGVDFTRLMALRMARNALAHNPILNGSPLVTVNEEVIPFLDGVIGRIKRLPTAASILIPRVDVFSSSLEEEIRCVVDMMLEKTYSHVPILDAGGKVLGVFSESTMLEMRKTGIGNNEAATMRDISGFLPLNRHTAEVFRFVPKNDPIAHLRCLCADALGKGERIGMFLVTETGTPDEPLLGVLTVWDIAGVSDTSTLKS